MQQQTWMYKNLCAKTEESFGYMSRNHIAESYSYLHFFISILAVFKLLSVVTMGSYCLHARQNLLSFVFLIIAILTGVRERLKADLICVSTMTKAVENQENYWSYVFLLLRTVS